MFPLYKNQPSETIGTYFFAALIVILLGISFLPESTYGFLIVEDGLIENGTAIAAFLGAYFSFQSFLWRKRTLSKHHMFLLLISLLFLFVAIEEISWGQRIIGIRPVDSGTESNYQREFNLHNIKYIDTLVYVGGFSFIVFIAGILPISTYLSLRVKQQCVRWGVPLMPKLMCLSMWLGFILLVFIPQIRHDIPSLFTVRFHGLYGIRELREFYFCFILLSYIFVDYFHLIKQGSPYDFGEYRSNK